FKTGGLITGILGIAIQPWRLLADPSGYIFTWLLGYSGGLGSIAGVLIADYWIVRRTELRLEDLYLSDGAYRYNAGWHVPGAVARLADRRQDAGSTCTSCNHHTARTQSTPSGIVPRGSRPACGAPRHQGD